MFTLGCGLMTVRTHCSRTPYALVVLLIVLGVLQLDSSASSIVIPIKTPSVFFFAFKTVDVSAWAFDVRTKKKEFDTGIQSQY
jgi:hypothetical protein